MHPSTFRVPADACDCHMHVYEDRFPLVPQATFKPPHAPLTDYLQVQRALGLSRAVIVQPNGYGFDNRCTLEALSALGDTARGIATVPPDVTDVELARLTRAGVRGVRFHLLPGGMLAWDSLEPMAARIAAFGWHVQLQLDGRELPRYEAALRRLPVPLVIDHNGKFLEPVAIDHPGFKSLLRHWCKPTPNAASGRATGRTRDAVRRPTRAICSSCCENGRPTTRRDAP